MPGAPTLAAKREGELRANPAAYDTAVQDRLLGVCADLTGVDWPS